MAVFARMIVQTTPLFLQMLTTAASVLMAQGNHPLPVLPNGSLQNGTHHSPASNQAASHGQSYTEQVTRVYLHISQHPITLVWIGPDMLQNEQQPSNSRSYPSDN